LGLSFKKIIVFLIGFIENTFLIKCLKKLSFANNSFSLSFSLNGILLSVNKDRTAKNAINKYKNGNFKNTTKNDAITAQITQAAFKLEKYSHQDSSE